MKFLIGASLGALALVAAAMPSDAADMPIKGYRPAMVAYYNWTGFYLGANGGYGMGHSTWTDPSTPGPAGTTGSFKTKGSVFGLTAGYNYQLGSVVLGLEGDYDWSSIKGTSASGACTGCETENTWLATFRGRAGYAFDRWLPYVTGGLAYGDIKATPPGGTTDKTTKMGYALGAGVEYAFLSNWSAKLEYLYVHLNDGTCSVACGAVPPIDVKFNTSLIRAGLNYKFSGPIFSRY